MGTHHAHEATHPTVMDAEIITISSLASLLYFMTEPASPRARVFLVTYDEVKMDGVFFFFFF